jgi:hypothetical protein
MAYGASPYDNDLKAAWDRFCERLMLFKGAHQ